MRIVACVWNHAFECRGSQRRTLLCILRNNKNRIYASDGMKYRTGWFVDMNTNLRSGTTAQNTNNTCQNVFVSALAMVHGRQQPTYFVNAVVERIEQV